MTVTSPYQSLLQQSLPRIFSLLDQNPISSTFGCFDRTYWHYKMVTDIPSMAYQQLTLVLALLYKNYKSFSLPYPQDRLLPLIQGALLFWMRHQHREGCFDEWYKNERSFCVTAFSAYAVTEVLLLLKEELDPQWIHPMKPSLQKAGVWLTRHQNSYVTNQMAMSLLALHNLTHLLEESSFQKAYEQRKAHLFSRQIEEGWFPEYGGPDIGYVSLTLDAIAKDYQKTNDKKNIEILQKGYDFLRHFFNPDGSIGGDYGSRNSQYIFPHGLEILKNTLPQAHDCLEEFYTSLQKNKVPTPLSVDDRYFAYFFMPNFLQAHLENVRQSHSTPGEPVEKSHLPSEVSPHDFFLPKAKILIFKNKAYSAIVEGNKCGILKVYREEDLLYSDFGYWVKTSSQKRLTNQSFKPTHCSVSTSPLTFKIEGYFSKLPFSSHPMAQHPIAFSLFNRIFLSSALVSHWFNHWVKKNFIFKIKKQGLLFCKEILFENNKIVMSETLRLCLKDSIIDLKPLSLALTPYSPTSHLQDVLVPKLSLALPTSDLKKICTLLNVDKKATILRTLHIPTAKLETVIS